MSFSLVRFRALTPSAARRLWLFAGILLLGPGALSAAFSGYLKIPDIDGESLAAGHEGEIEILSMSWSVTRPAAVLGSTRTAGRPEFSGLTVGKELDKASPYLALACARGSNLGEIVLTARRSSGDASIAYLTITLSDAIVTSYASTTDGDDRPEEQVVFSFSRIQYRYVETENDHSAGDEHEIEYDILAGV